MVEGDERKVHGGWMIRPCEMYKEEYRDCNSYRGKFHQLFTTGETRDCSEWKEDYVNCVKYQDTLDLQALKSIIAHEKQRVATRVANVLSNDVWQLRDEPRTDWNSPLPEHLENLRQKGSLAKKPAKEEARKIKKETVPPNPTEADPFAAV
ncbi:hypothetical protein RvY_14511 [Ramazzottius varieornatus]|uniref:Synaptic plasticity regulator PANTS n=1 Tax=Ramazzottius varieornatus TaxID=947166 RepID=A0A1D1W009_RAMVA|nr:hypothetical protein RvY_14511 [Ramazzottius varieornatus]